MKQSHHNGIQNGRGKSELVQKNTYGKDLTEVGLQDELQKAKFLTGGYDQYCQRKQTNKDKSGMGIPEM